MQPDTAGSARTATLEAFADTIIPGAKRTPDDLAVAGVAEGGGAVASGAIELLEQPGGGLADALETLAVSLDAHAERYARANGVTVADSVPPFVALPSPDRIALVLELTRPGHPEKQMWVGLALFCNMAFDSAAHLSTADALAAGHPGLQTIGYATPEADGVWRFPSYSYGRPLSPPHPATTSTGDPA